MTDAALRVASVAETAASGPNPPERPRLTSPKPCTSNLDTSRWRGAFHCGLNQEGSFVRRASLRRHTTCSCNGGHANVFEGDECRRACSSSSHFRSRPDRPLQLIFVVNMAGTRRMRPGVESLQL